ncbi:hypothetical protein JAAARDRAFT_74462 [Jaapia argillacea MUCL 33604]|uniref:Geranylgeranyl pyrophosphate synthetase n=1 Tax=Jaapia argillacea MUCL 33604 TaxID=933084 RepID=A0A067PHH4_9AGAM|nr:hypothetical protein JAAARDRAFT_74462 [Jaapia argillacea MUCL 33604]
MRSTRGNYRRPARPQAPLPPLDPLRSLNEGLAETPVCLMEVPSIETDAPAVKVTQLEYIGSYNWVDSSQPTIIVPGSPPHWKNIGPPFTVAHDQGVVYRDQNGFRMPQQTLLPLFTAVDVVQEEDGKDGLPWSSMDFVTDRNGLRKLLRWIEGTAGRDFRIDMQLAGKRTVLLNRWETHTREYASPSFGFNFEKKTTQYTSGCEQSTGHHRIVKYDFDGLKMVVRFEVDACIPPPATKRDLSSASNVDDLIDSLANVNIKDDKSGDPSQTIAGGASPTLKIIHAGSEVPQSNIVELGTRSERNLETYSWIETYPQLFLSQTPHHFLGVHKNGRFSTIQKRKLGSPDLLHWEKRMEDNFKKLRKALEEIQKLVIEHGQRGRLTLVSVDGKLKVYERAEMDSCLSDDVIRRFEI